MKAVIKKTEKAESDDSTPQQAIKQSRFRAETPYKENNNMSSSFIPMPNGDPPELILWGTE